jgi:hypothetical protein
LARQKQHYVPKFILRQFLCHAKKEQVAVYDKHDDRTFVTAIENIMAERSFHDLSMEDGLISFEPIASKFEELVLPHYQNILRERRLDRTDEERSALAFLVSFQFVRTKAHRHFDEELEKAVRTRVEQMGRRMEDIAGWEEPTEEVRKREHLLRVLSSVDAFATLISAKDLLLMEAGDSRGFYLGDHPVSLHNTRQFGPYGNLGLAVPGIEIYMPLSSDLLLAAWCPSLLAELTKQRNEAMAQCEQTALREVLAGRASADQMKATLAAIRTQFSNADALLDAFHEGKPIGSTAENMDYFNSIQASFAYRYVVEKHGDFDIAQRHNRDFPKFRRGHRPTVD